MGYVFISYAREDKAMAREIQLGLERVGVQVWWDEKLQLGRAFDKPIVDALNGADAVLVLWSRSSIRSEWVQREAQLGLERNVLIPVLLEEVRPPGRFAAVNGVNLAGWAPGRPNTEFNRMVRALLPEDGGRRGGWTAERRAADTLHVRLDQADHVLQYTQGRVFIDGHPAAATANPLDYNRSFDFDLSDGGRRYVCHLVVRVSAFRGSVKRMTLSIGNSVIYDG